MITFAQWRAPFIQLAVYLFWTALSVVPQAAPNADHVSLPSYSVAGAFIVCVLIYVQIVLGAFVAGLDAGQGYNTWPLMDGAFVPSGLLAMDPAWRNFFESALTVQFVHRMFAYVVLLAVAWHIVRVLRHTQEGPQQLSIGLLGMVVVLQVLLGIWTLLARVPISLGLLHQGGAIVLLGAALWHLHVMRGK